MPHLDERKPLASLSKPWLVTKIELSPKAANSVGDQYEGMIGSAASAPPSSGAPSIGGQRCVLGYRPLNDELAAMIGIVC
jgi:hypothetical protein